MAPILYMQNFSGPVRSTLLTARAIGLKLRFRVLDLAKQEHLTEDFLKLNPQHTIPTLDDNGTILWDSHAINAYLVQKYGKDDSLYPKDFAKRARIDQRLHFDSGLIFSWLRNIARGMKYKGRKALTGEQIEGLENGYGHLNTFLNGNKWVTGEEITIADFSLIANVSSLDFLYPVNPGKFSNVNTWMKRAEGLPYYDANREASINMAPPILYMQDFSPPVRSVLLTTQALGLKLEKRIVDLFKKEHLTDNFLKLNPQHTIPTLDDNGTVLWDSHVINAYLVGKYGKDDSLYPKDLAKRAIVDQRLHFDSGVIYSWLRYITKSYIYRGSTTLTEDQIEHLEEGYNFLDSFLKGSQWVAGDTVTIADFSLIATISTLNLLHPVDPGNYTNVVNWLKRAEDLPYYHVNAKGLESFKKFFKMMLK